MMPTSGVPVPGPKANGRKLRRAEGCGVLHLALHPSSCPLITGSFPALHLVFIYAIAGVLGHFQLCRMMTASSPPEGKWLYRHQARVDLEHPFVSMHPELHLLQVAGNLS